MLVVNFSIKGDDSSGDSLDISNFIFGVFEAGCSDNNSIVNFPGVFDFRVNGIRVVDVGIIYFNLGRDINPGVNFVVSVND